MSLIIAAITAMGIYFPQFLCAEFRNSKEFMFQLGLHSSEGLKCARLSTSEIIHSHRWKISANCCGRAQLLPMWEFVGCLSALTKLIAFPRVSDPRD